MIRCLIGFNCRKITAISSLTAAVGSTIAFRSEHNMHCMVQFATENGVHRRECLCAAYSMETTFSCMSASVQRQYVNTHTAS